MNDPDFDAKMAARSTNTLMPNGEYYVRKASIGPNILTAYGEYFDFFELEKNKFDIYTIAHALSNICRFTGHSKTFYSVAQHSVLVSCLVPNEFALHGLLHDAAEAFIGDVSSPLKKLLPDYKAIEMRIEADIFSRFDLPTTIPPEVKRADLIALRTEQRDLMHINSGSWPSLDGIEPHAATIFPLPPNSANALFLKRFWELLPRETA